MCRFTFHVFRSMIILMPSLRLSSTNSSTVGMRSGENVSL